MDQVAGSNDASRIQDRLGLFLSHRAELIRYASTITGDAALAEDVLQEAWARFDAAAAAQPLHEPVRFLYRIVRNLALDGRRRQKFEEKIFAEDLVGVASFIASDEPSAQTRVEAADELAFVLAAVETLPERTRRAFLLHRVEGLTLTEVGVQLGISKSLVHELIVSALDHCRTTRRRGT